MKPIDAQTRFSTLFKAFELLIIIFTVFLTNSNALIRFRQFPEVVGYSDNEANYIIAAILAAVGILFILWRVKLLQAYLAAWKANPLLIVFLLYCVTTLLWSVYPAATQYKLFLLMYATFAGAYVAVRYGLRGTLDLLTWIAAVSALLSIFLVIYFPFIGMMLQNEIFYGSWVGIFWHRNHTGNIFAFFNVLFLLRLILDSEGDRTRKILFAAFYVLTAAMVFGSRSATGFIVFLFLNFVTLLIALWLKLHERMKPVHYYVVSGVLLAGFLTFITNTAFFFGLLGRSSAMTGRIPLWQDLFRRIYLQKPLLGYGYGALWMQRTFRIEMQLHHGWPYQVYFADNGFFDLLLNTGLAGLLLFLSVYIFLGLRSFQQAVREKSWLHFLPFITFLYIFIGNLTYSFMLEVDQFVWMLLVIMLFLTNSPSSKSIPQP